MATVWKKREAELAAEVDRRLKAADAEEDKLYGTRGREIIFFNDARDLAELHASH
jgi:hypothetical protein